MGAADPALSFRLPLSPYPGLRSFSEEEWTIFFGREKMVDEVLERLGRQRTVFVHGDSGCGKSSLVRAGVLPAIKRDFADRGLPFVHATMRPAQSPLRKLAQILALKLGIPATETAAGRALPESWNVEQAALLWWNLLADRSALDAIRATLAARGGLTFCLIVDQFEEIFRWVRDYPSDEAEFFCDLIKSVSDSGDSDIYVLITMRSDYLGHCAQFRGLPELINSSQYLLPGLELGEVAYAIEGPAELYGGSISPELTKRLLREIGTGADALPLLQHSLARMYDRAARDSDSHWQLGVADLDALSGVRTALSNHAEAVYQQLVETSPDAAEAIAWIFRSLSEIDVGGKAVRRPQPLRRLRMIANASDKIVDTIVEQFSAPGRSFVTSIPIEGSEHDLMVDISHEAFIRNWFRFHKRGDAVVSGESFGWLQAEFEDALTWRSVALSARARVLNPRATLGPEMTRARRGWYESISIRPEWARPYLLHATGCKTIEDEPEWRDVAALMADSLTEVAAQNAKLKRSLNLGKLIGLIATSVGILGLGSFMITEVHRGRELERVNEQLRSATAELTKRNKEQSRLSVQLDAANKDLMSGGLFAVLARTAPRQGEPSATELIQGQRAKAIAETGAQGWLIARAGPGERWIWIGSASPNSWQLTGEGGRVDPHKLVAPKSYRLKSDMVVRNRPPLGNGQTGEGVGVITANSSIIARELVQRPTARGTQVWARVERPKSTFNVRLFIAGSGNTKHQEIRVGIANAGDRVSNIGKGQPDQNHVKYCSAGDRSGAVQLAKAIDRALVSDGHALPPLAVEKINKCSPQTPQGTLELWLDLGT